MKKREKPLPASIGTLIGKAGPTRATLVCSPAHASLMAEPLHHNHGVLFVEHTVHADQAVLRTQHPWSAQRLTGAGYNTACFGKWHVERSNELSRFGWQQ